MSENSRGSLLNAAHPARWKILLAFAIIYFVWGSTYLFIRIGVGEIPPFLYAAMRFSIAGEILYIWMRATGTPSPTRREWSGAMVLGTLMFLLDYGPLFWAEQRVPSGIAAVILATIPLFIALLEIIFLRTQNLTLRLSMGLLAGLAGVGVLMGSSVSLGGATLDRKGVLALLMASLSWAVGTVSARKLVLPSSKGMSAAAQMFCGGMQLFVLALVSGEVTHFHIQNISWHGWFALAYLIVFGSLIAFTAYVWLLEYESPTMVGTYAYVNPVIAVILGYFFVNELIGLRTVLGTVLILVSVALITLNAGKAKTKAKEIELIEEKS